MICWTKEFILSLLSVRIFWSKPGEISEEGCWVLYHECYMYTEHDWCWVICDWITHFRDERYLVG